MPNIWDVAGGLALAEAAGRQAMVRADDGWRAFDAFETDGGDLREWRRGLILGDPQAVATMAQGSA